MKTWPPPFIVARSVGSQHRYDARHRCRDGSGPNLESNRRCPGSDKKNQASLSISRNSDRISWMRSSSLTFTTAQASPGSSFRFSYAASIRSSLVSMAYEAVDQLRLRPKCGVAQLPLDVPSSEGWRWVTGLGKRLTTNCGCCAFPIGVRLAFQPDSCGSTAS